MKNITTVFFLIFASIASASATELTPYEMPRTHVVAIHDESKDRQYELYIKLPDGYSENTDTNYPVIYTTDAAWHMDMLSGATEYITPDVILVGISWQIDLEAEQPFASRFRDYTVTEFGNEEIQAQYQGGQAATHLTFIRENVIPYIEREYRTVSAQRSYFGYSLGGLFGVYALLSEPDTFKNYIIGSPAVRERNAGYIDELEAASANKQRGLNTNVFISIGELEERHLSRTEELVTVLSRRSQSGLVVTGLEIIEASDHSSAFPETVIRGVKWLKEQSDER